MNRREYILNRIYKLTQHMPMAEDILEMLNEEGVLHLGHGNAEVDAIIEKFKAVYGTTKTSKYDRWAAHRLAGRYSGSAVVGIIDLLGQRATDKYAPVPRSVADLEEKWASVLAFLRKQTGDETIAL